MTIDEAIKNREECLKYLEGIGKSACPECVEAVRWSVKALKAMKSENSYSPGHIDRETWEPCAMCETCSNCWMAMNDKYGTPCNKCIDFSKFHPVSYCRYCGRPLTSESWAELEKRLRW